MAFKKDHDYRTELFKNVTKGMDHNQSSEFHQYLHDNYKEEKDSMTYNTLLAAAKEFMSNNYSEYEWNGQKWFVPPQE